MNKEQFFSNKKLVVLMAGLVIVILVLFLIRLFTAGPANEPTPSIPTSSSPISVPSTPPFRSASPSAVILPSSPAAPTVYTPGNLKTDYERISQKRPLSQADLQAKQEIIAPLNGQSGVIRTTAAFQIEYVKGPDSFMVEIRNANTDQAKKEAVRYLTNEGLSQNGVCNLPVVFYLSSKIQSELASSGRTFNPIPDGC